MTLLPRSLLGRTALIIAVLLLATQAITLYLFRLYYYGPLVEEAAGRAASQIGMVVSAMQVMHMEEREEFLDLLEAREQIRVLFDSGGVLSAQEPEDEFLRAFANRLRKALGPETAFYVPPRNARALWVKVTAAQELLWIGIPRTQIERPFPWWWVAWASLCALLAVGAAFALLRRVGRPLRELSAAASVLAAGARPSAVKLEGPREVRDVASAFNGMVTDLQRQEEDRAVLLAGISHDLRTPLTRLRLGVELLKGDAVTKADMVRDTEEMDGILGQFLDFARIQSGEPFQAVPVNALVEQACAAYGAQGERVRLALGADVTVHAQPVALRRAVSNLVDNACKYSDGEVEVATVTGNQDLTICVRDRGPGIPPDQVESMMRPFTRMEQARTGARGAGLGLAIVQRVAREQGGALRISPRAGGGTDACLILPLRRSDGESA